MRADRIITHEDYQSRVPMYTFLAQRWVQQGQQSIPPDVDAPRVGELDAYINQGRWVVDCPNCSGAVCASKMDPWFFCIYCGVGVYDVKFPPDAAAIEAVLLKRPEHDGWFARSRNWRPSETVAGLRRENAERGIS